MTHQKGGIIWTTERERDFHQKRGDIFFNFTKIQCTHQQNLISLSSIQRAFKAD
jgi:hypothetical protein